MEYGLWDVGPTAADVLDFRFDAAEGQVIPDVAEYLEGSRTLIIVIMDSLGYRTYLDLKGYMPHVKGLESALKADSMHTTPAIATILLGLKLRTHQVVSEEDTYSTGMETVLEAAEKSGLRSGLVIEERGAITMMDRIGTVVGIGENEDIFSYDASITKGVIHALQNGCELVAAHLRAVDRQAHLNRDLTAAARSIDRNIEKITGAGCGTGVLVVGDHPLHAGGNDEDHVALIAIAPRY